jgi:hypothetical protein
MSEVLYYRSSGERTLFILMIVLTPILGYVTAASYRSLTRVANSRQRQTRFLYSQKLSTRYQLRRIMVDLSFAMYK